MASGVGRGGVVWGGNLITRPGSGGDLQAVTLAFECTLTKEKKYL